MDLAVLDFRHRLSLQRVECPVLRVWPVLVLARAWEWDMRCVQWMVPGQAGRGERRGLKMFAGTWLRLLAWTEGSSDHWPHPFHHDGPAPAPAQTLTTRNTQHTSVTELGNETNFIRRSPPPHWYSILFYTASLELRQKSITDFKM